MIKTLLPLLSLLSINNILYGMEPVAGECSKPVKFLEAQSKLCAGVVFSKIKLVKEALEKGADPNQPSFQREGDEE